MLVDHLPVFSSFFLKQLRKDMFLFVTKELSMLKTSGKSLLSSETVINSTCSGLSISFEIGELVMTAVPF